METLIADLIIALLKPLVSFFARRKAAKQEAAELVGRDAALKDGAHIRDAADQAEDASHVQTDSEIDHLGSDVAAGRPGSVLSDDVDEAISAANAGVRRA